MNHCFARVPRLCERVRARRSETLPRSTVLRGDRIGRPSAVMHSRSTHAHETVSADPHLQIKTHYKLKTRRSRARAGREGAEAEPVALAVVNNVVGLHERIAQHSGHARVSAIDANASRQRLAPAAQGCPSLGPCALSPGDREAVLAVRVQHVVVRRHGQGHVSVGAAEHELQRWELNRTRPRVACVSGVHACAAVARRQSPPARAASP
jgi:hypothetical protein